MGQGELGRSQLGIKMKKRGFASTRKKRRLRERKICWKKITVLVRVLPIFSLKSQNLAQFKKRTCF